MYFYRDKNIQGIFCAVTTLSFHLFIYKHRFSTRYSSAI